jgi:hypothetical protein
MNIFLRWCALIGLYSSVTIGDVRGQAIEGNEKFITRLISVTPYFKNEGGTFGFMQEWCTLGNRLSYSISIDFETRINTFHTTNIRYYAYYFRPGIRYYYKKSNTGFFFGASILAAFEKFPLGWESVLGSAIGISVGFRHAFKNGILLEVDPFFGYGLARITPYNNSLFNDGPFYQGRYYFISNIRIGYRFNGMLKK